MTDPNTDVNDEHLEWFTTASLTAGRKIIELHVVCRICSAHIEPLADYSGLDAHLDWHRTLSRALMGQPEGGHTAMAAFNSMMDKRLSVPHDPKENT